MTTLRRSLVVSHLLPTVLILPLAAIVLAYLVETQLVLSSSARALASQAQLIAYATAEYPRVWTDAGEAARFAADVRRLIDARLALLGPDGLPLGTSAAAALLPRPSAGDTPEVEVRHGWLEQRVAVRLPVSDRGQRVVGFVELTQTFEGLASRIGQARTLIVLILAAELAAGTGLGLILAIRLERPIVRLIDAVGRVAAGKTTAPIPLRGPAELRRLADSVNALEQRLQALQEQRRRSLANLVHELGRPLGAMRAAVHALQRRAGDDPTIRRELLQGIDQEIERMQPLLEDMAELHRQTQGALQLSLQPVALDGWLSGLLPTWRAAAGDKGLSWREEIGPGLPTAEIDADQLARAIGNILSNAVRYTPAGGAVEVTARVRDELRIEIGDSGPGIAPEEQALIFEPFYRSQRQNRFPQGLGVGLTIAREIVLAHGGRLDLVSAPGAGSRFSVVLPLPPAPAGA